MDGQRFERTGGNAAGLIFYNDQGDECGGLVFGGKGNPEGHEAEAALLFDRFRQDQVIGILHQETSDYRRTGLQVWDSPDIPLSAMARTRNSAAGLDESERSAAADEIGRSDPLEVTRVFVGKSVDGAAVVVLHDGQGRPRLRLTVDDIKTPQLQVLDGAGEAIHTWPEEPLCSPVGEAQRGQG